ncbi:MAG: glycosyltransferase [Thermoleophilia bacterium]|jgi:glucosyl-3-phosphoglycerate synthase
MTTETISVIIPVLNAANTIERLVSLVRRDPRVVEVLVIDGGSVDGTYEMAVRAGARVTMSSLLGKGVAMTDGLEVATGDMILFLDGDILETGHNLVEEMISPLVNGGADLVKATFIYDPGRVTVLTARPLLGTFFPEIAGFGQPISGLIAARRSFIKNIPLEDDYGVDVGLLIDAVVARNARVVEVDVGRVEYEDRSLEAMGEIAREVTQVVLDRAWRHERLNINQIVRARESEQRTNASLVPSASHIHEHRRFALLGMDGVLLDGRFIIELAERIGAQSELALILGSKLLREVERTRAIASLFKGVFWEVFEETARSMPLMEGAVDTVVTLRKAGYRVGVISGSFHVAAEIIRRRVFADFSVAHVMHFRNHTATGDLTLSPLMLDTNGCSEHDCCKSNVIRQLQVTAGLLPKSTLAVGDGINDICMLREAGISVAFRPKSDLVKNAATYTLNGSLLDVLGLLPPTRSSTPEHETPADLQ